MATTAQSIIEAGYVRSSANAPGKGSIDGELIQHIHRVYQALHALMAIHQPDNASTSSTLTFTGSPGTAALPTDIIDIVRVEQSSGARAYLVPAVQKDWLNHLTPAVYRKGNSLVSLGRSGDPVSAGTLTLIYIDAPATISALASTLDPRFPVRYETILVLEIAIYLSLKDEKRNQQEFQNLKVELGAAYTMFLKLIGASNTAGGPAKSGGPAAIEASMLGVG